MGVVTAEDEVGTEEAEVDGVELSEDTEADVWAFPLPRVKPSGRLIPLSLAQVAGSTPWKKG